MRRFGVTAALAWALGLAASAPFGCVTAGPDAEPCDLVAAQVEACFLEAPEDLASACAADPERLTAWEGWTCEELEAPAGKGLSPAAPAGAGEPCLWNLECEGSLVCRLEAAGGGLGHCADLGTHAAELAADRYCDPVTDHDCADGDRCLGIDGRAGTCEADRYGAPCGCPHGTELCGGEPGGCGGGLLCVQGVCRRPCRSAVPGSCPTLAPVCAQLSGSDGASLGSFCHSRI